MDRVNVPEYNRGGILQKKWQAYNKRVHKKNLYESKPMVDNNEPSSLRYPLIKTKKEQILEGKCTFTTIYDDFANVRSMHWDWEGKQNTPGKDDQYHDTYLKSGESHSFLS